MSVVIKGMKMPKEDELLCIRIYPSGKVTVDMDLQCKQVAEAFELPDHGDLIDRDVVVARLADWSKRLIETYGENDEYVICLSEVLEGLGCDDVVIPAERSEAKMTDLISRQAAIEAICYNCMIKETCNGICDDTDRLRELQTLEPKHGKWIPHPTETDWDVCSVCGIETHRRFHYNDGVYGGYDVEESFAYCPNCGAKMDREGET